MTAVPLVFDAATTATYAAITSNVAGSLPVAGVIGQKTVWAFLLDTTCPADTTDITVDIDLTAWVLAGGIGYGDSDGISIQLLDVGGPVQIPFTATTGGDLYTAPGNNGTVRVGYLGQGGTTSGPGIVSVTATGITGVVGPLALGIIADMADSVGHPGNLIEIAAPTTADVTFASGSPCAAVVPNTVDDTATTPVNVPVTVSVGTNDDPSPCAPGCMVHRQPSTDFIDLASTATGITASVDVAGVATVEAATPGTVIIHVESGCSPSCDANGTDVTAWTTQTLTVTVTPAVTPGPCVEIVPVFDPAKTAALAALISMDEGTPAGVTATTGVGTEWAAGVYTVTIPLGCENDIESITAESTVSTSGGLSNDTDGALIGVTDDYSTLTAWGTVIASAGLESTLSPGFVWTGFAGAGGPNPIGPLIKGTWSGGTLPKTEFDVAVLVDARSGLTPDGEFITAAAPKVCVTYAEGSPCAPEPLPCVEIPVTFDQAATDAIGLAFGIDPTTDPASVEADADIGGKQTIGVWLIELPEGCDAEVVSVQAAATVDVSATMDPDVDGAFIAVVDQTLPFPAGFGTLAPTTGDADLQVPSSLSTGFTSSGGTAWPAGPSTVTLDGVWSNGTLPASTLALLVYADALGTSPSGSNIRVNVPETVCVTFANPCGPTPPVVPCTWSECVDPFE